MDVTQIGFDRHASKAGTADPERMRIFRLEIAPKMANDGISGSAGAQTQKFDLNPHSPQCAICCNQDRRAKRLARDGNIMHRP
jgi:hypothetical protein